VLAFLAAGLTFGLGQGVVYPTLNALSVDLAEVGQLGRVQAFFNGTFNLGVTSGAGVRARARGARVRHRAASVGAAGCALAAFALFLGGTRAPAHAVVSGAG
jgi:hypothetical protein